MSLLRWRDVYINWEEGIQGKDGRDSKNKRQDARRRGGGEQEERGVGEEGRKGEKGGGNREFGVVVVVVDLWLYPFALLLFLLLSVLRRLFLLFWLSFWTVFLVLASCFCVYLERTERRRTRTRGVQVAVEGYNMEHAAKHKEHNEEKQQKVTLGGEPRRRESSTRTSISNGRRKGRAERAGRVGQEKKQQGEKE